jgi:hypothetical protein
MNRINRIIGITAIAVAAVFSWADIPEAAIELVTVPEKESVQLTIYNSADITMVRERRTLTFKKGMNRIQFAWAGTLIDPTSLRLRFVTERNRLDLLDTTYPPDRREALQWNIRSEINGPAQVEITYFTSGLTWTADYVGITNENEDSLTLKGYVKVINNSGEDYPNATVRLVVGTINLVEKISDLAKGPAKYPAMKSSRRSLVRSRFKEFVNKAEESKDSTSGMLSEKKIIKEGLSEYFLFTIEGKESISNGWKKRMKAVYAENVPLKTIFRLSDTHSQTEVVKYYEFFNKKSRRKSGKGQLGDSPLPDGVYKIFTRKKDMALTFRASVNYRYVAAGDRVKLRTYGTGDVRVDRVVKDYRRVDIKVVKDFYKKPYVRSYYEKYFYETTITNTLPRKVLVEVERKFSGEYRVEDLKTKTYKVDKYTLKYFPDLRASSKMSLKYRVLVFRGRR